MEKPKTDNRPKVSVVLPSYNERDNIEEAINRISKTLGKRLFEIIVVDDNSPDGTWKIVQDMRNPKYKLIRRTKEKGLSSALRTGVDNAKGDIVVWLDCDLGIPPEDILKLVDKLDSKLGDYDVAIGSRYVGNGRDLRPKWRAQLSTLTNIVARLFLGSKVKDYTSGFIAVKKEVLKKVKISPEGFGEYFVQFVYDALKNKFKIIEVGYIYSTRKSGTSKSDGDILTLFKLGFQYGIRVFKLWIKKQKF